MLLAAVLPRVERLVREKIAHLVDCRRHAMMDLRGGRDREGRRV
jgi:hypothetical protein